MNLAFKSDVLILDKQLKKILNSRVIDLEQVTSLQQKLDIVADKYKNLEDDVSLYKLYEIQAYIHFINENTSEAERFIMEAERLKGHQYYDAEILHNFIYNKRKDLKGILAHEIKREGKKQAAQGFLWFIGALIITYISYNYAENKVKETGEDQEYTIFYGAVIFGVYMLFRGIYYWVMSYKKASEMIYDDME